MRDEKQSDKDFTGKLPDELNQIAEELNSFRVQVSRVDRDRMLFEAGRAAGQQNQIQAVTVSAQTLRWWQIATVSSSTVAVSLCSLLLMVLADHRSSHAPALISTESSQDMGSTIESKSSAEISETNSRQKSSDSRRTLADSELSTVVTERRIDFSRFHATQRALAKSIDSKFDEAEIWPEQVAKNTHESLQTVHREEILRPLSLMKRENSQRMIDVLTEEPRL